MERPVQYTSRLVFACSFLGGRVRRWSRHPEEGLRKIIYAEVRKIENRFLTSRVHNNNTTIVGTLFALSNWHEVWPSTTDFVDFAKYGTRERTEQFYC
eukprot:scaffold23140_cov178-Amphora_coffeaeformis.AAC.2